VVILGAGPYRASRLNTSLACALKAGEDWLQGVINDPAFCRGVSHQQTGADPN